MIAVDTNVIVRFLVRDDARQAEAVRRRLKRAESERERLFVPLLVILETIWVLESAYDKSRSDILASFQNMRQMPVFEFENDVAFEKLLVDGDKYKAGLADILTAHAAQSNGCEGGITFDKAASKMPFFSLLK